MGSQLPVLVRGIHPPKTMVHIAHALLFPQNL